MFIQDIYSQRKEVTKRVAVDLLVRGIIAIVARRRVAERCDKSEAHQKAKVPGFC